MYNYLTKRLKKKNRGFTLIEVIVVIGILAILSALAIPAVGGYLDNAKAQTNVANAKMLINATSAYYAATPAAVDADLDDKAASLNTTVLFTGKYLSQPVKTAGAGDYTIHVVGKVITVSWPSDTKLAAEGKATTGGAVNGAVATNLTFPQ